MVSETDNDNSNTDDPPNNSAARDIKIVEFAVAPPEESGRSARLISLTNDGVNLYAVSTIEGKIFKISRGSATLWFNVKQALAGDYGWKFREGNKV